MRVLAHDIPYYLSLPEGSYVPSFGTIRSNYAFIVGNVPSPRQKVASQAPCGQKRIMADRPSRSHIDASPHVQLSVQSVRRLSNLYVSLV